MNWVKLTLVFGFLNLLWEVFQLPFYTIWSTAPLSEIVVAVIHCTAGDILIGVTLAFMSHIILQRLRLNEKGPWVFLACFIPLAVVYTVFSEWFNVHILGSWVYESAMPLLPPFGTGMTPVLQWIIVPLLAWAWADTSMRARLAGRRSNSEGI